MVKSMKTMLGISVFWLALSMLMDSISSLVLPAVLVDLVNENNRATTLGLLTFTGLLAGMVILPLLGVLSDRLRPRWGRRGTLGIAVLLILASLALFGSSQSLPAILITYLLVPLSGSLALSAQQGFIPDLIPVRQRDLASSLKNFMWVGGVMLGFFLTGQLLRDGQPVAALGAIATFLVISYLLVWYMVREPVHPLPAAATLLKPGPWMLTRPDPDDLAHQRAYLWLIVSRFLFLLGIFGIARFLLLFVSDRMVMEAGQAAEETGFILAGLALVAVLSAGPAARMAERVGRLPMMVFGAIASAAGALLLMDAYSSREILLYGLFLAFGAASFAVSNWSMADEVMPVGILSRTSAQANSGLMAASACAGLFGPLIDLGNRISPGSGYSYLFAGSAVFIILSSLVLRGARRVAAESEVPGYPS